MPEIPDFSSRTWQGRRDRAELRASILEGRGAHMPGFADSLSAEQARELVELVRAFGPAAARSPDTPTGDFDTRLSQLREEFESLRREYRSVSHPALEGAGGMSTPLLYITKPIVSIIW